MAYASTMSEIASAMLLARLAVKGLRSTCLDLRPLLLLASAQAPAILVLMGYDQAAYVQAMLRMGIIGYRYQADKFGLAELTSIAADLVTTPLVAECPIQLEAVVEQVHAFDEQNCSIKAIEMRIVRVHIDEQLLVPETKNYIDPEKWNPLIMNFCEFFGLGGKIHQSRLETAFYGLPRKAQRQEVSSC